MVRIAALCAPRLGQAFQCTAGLCSDCRTQSVHCQPVPYEAVNKVQAPPPPMLVSKYVVSN